MDYKQKFEPIGNIVIHGAGQSPSTFKKYSKALNKSKPIIYMLYIRINEINIKFSKKFKEMQNISEELIPQIGLNLKAGNKGSQCKEILKGQYDKQLLFLCKKIEELKNPTFLRIGYEFNNPSHNYKSGDYVKTFKYIVNFFRKNNVSNVAFIWCACTAFDKNIKNIMKFYPGDVYVDWFGNDLFGVRHFADNRDKATEDFYKESKKHKKPLMICESSASRVGVLNGISSWNKWFKPYFKWIKGHKNVKGFCYINFNWGADWKTPEWGNCRIEENKIIQNKYNLELQNKRYLSNTKIKEFLKLTYN